MSKFKFLTRLKTDKYSQGLTEIAYQLKRIADKEWIHYNEENELSDFTKETTK